MSSTDHSIAPNHKAKVVGSKSCDQDACCEAPNQSKSHPDHVKDTAHKLDLVDGSAALAHAQPKGNSDHDPNAKVADQHHKVADHKHGEDASIQESHSPKIERRHEVADHKHGHKRGEDASIQHAHKANVHDGEDDFSSTSSQTIVLTYPLGDSSKVSVAGSWNGWARQPMFMTEEKLVFDAHLQPGEYQYKFIVGDEWKIDPEKPTTTDSSGNVNNVLVVCGRCCS